MRTMGLGCGWLALVLAVGLGSPARAAEADVAVFDRVWTVVRDHFYDRELHGVDWDAMREHYRPRYESAVGADERRAVLQRLLSELRASHTSVLEQPVYRSMMAELNNEPLPTFGVLLEESLPGRLFVRSMFEGGPAAVAGCSIGDRVVRVNGVDAVTSPFVVDAGFDPALPGPRLYSIPARAAGSRVRLTLQSDPAGERVREVELVAEAMTGVDATRRGARVVERDGVRVGVVHVWYCQRGVVDAVREALTGPLADCDALVLDLRGRGGMSDVAAALVDLFRGEKRRVVGTARHPPLWRKPVIALIDGRTRSAKELMAFRLRAANLATLVGERTEGAVLGAAFFALQDGAYLELASVDVPIDGERLEGVGVEPDVAVDFPVAYANGADPILERGLELASASVVTRRRHRAPLGAKGPL
ncbi:MAG: hypothetical protein JNL94_09205 [Planctomycetes bacterium]|nr:hypothetical protein [Planctomycetota bacterium]